MTNPVRSAGGARAERLAVGITVANLAVFGVAWAANGGTRGAPPVAGLAALVGAFAVVRSLQMRLYFSQHRASFTLTDAVVASALFVAGAPWLGLAAGLGEILYSLPNRKSPLKTAFNASNQAAIGVIAALVFTHLGGHSRPGPGSWLPALAATAAWSFLNATAISAVISKAEQSRFTPTFVKSVPTAAITTVLAAPVGVLVVELLRSGPVYLVLLVPLVVGISFNNRYAALQRDEHLRVERLYEATSRSAQLSEDPDVISTIAEESRLLVTATASICVVREGPNAPWSGRTARPDGVGGTRAGDVDRLMVQAEKWAGSTLVLPVPESLRGLAPSAEVMMLARSPEGSAVDLVLAVFRERSGGRRVETGVGETLAAFAAHGAVMAANASLIVKLQRSLASQLEANQRKDEFVATISHELRTPLTVMLGAAQTMSRLEDRLAPADRERLLQTAVDQGQRLKLLIEDLLLVASSERDDQAACQLLPMGTRQLEADLRTDVPAAHTALVRVINRAPEVEILTERFKARQVVANLVQNALKYAPGSEVEVVIEEAGWGVDVRVVDHGPGIPSKDRERVFERFFQLDQSSTRTHGGAGLGLYICRKLAGQLDARLHLGETVGGGCTFVLHLPRRPVRRVDDLAARHPSPPPQAVGVGMLRRPVVVPPGGHTAPEEAKELSI